MQPKLSTPDGIQLNLRHWPAGVAGRGVVLIVHGLGEHSGRYEHVAAFLNAAGWHVVSYDQRGHGASEGLRGQLRQPHDLLHDLGAVIDAARARHLEGPLVLLGHSMGGLVAGRFVAEGSCPPPPAAWYRQVDGLVMTSPALNANMNPLQKMLLAVLGVLSPNLAVGNGLKPGWISRDPKVVAAYRADPLVHGRISPKLVNFILHSGELVRRQAPYWKVPTLLMFAGSDRCVPPQGSRDFAAAAPGPLVMAQEFPALAHEILNEPEQGEVLAALEAWLALRRQ